MKKLLDVYLQVHEILDSAKMEIVSTDTHFGQGVMIIDKTNGQFLIISESAQNHMHRIERNKPVEEIEIEEKEPIKTFNEADSITILLDAYSREGNVHALRILSVRLQPVIKYLVDLVSKNENANVQFLKITAEKELPDILTKFIGNENELERYVLAELRYRLEKTARDRQCKIQENKSLRKGATPL